MSLPFVCFLFGRHALSVYAPYFICHLPLNICVNLGCAKPTINVLSATTSLVFYFYTVFLRSLAVILFN